MAESNWSAGFQPACDAKIQETRRLEAGAPVPFEHRTLNTEVSSTFGVQCSMFSVSGH
jgi:hypothetical protein